MRKRNCFYSYCDCCLIDCFCSYVFNKYMFRWAPTNAITDQWGNAMGVPFDEGHCSCIIFFCFFAQCLETAVYLINCCLEEINLLSLLPSPQLADWRGLLLLGRGWVDCFLLFLKESFTFGMLSNYSLWFNIHNKPPASPQLRLIMPHQSAMCRICTFGN